MRTVKLSKFLIVAVMLSLPAWAQSAETGEYPDTATPYIPSAVYKGSLSQGASSSGLGTGLNGEVDNSPKIRIFRVEKLVYTSSSSNVLVGDDHISFTAKAPMPRVDGALSLVSTAKQAMLENGTTKLVQVLSLLTTRQINTEFAYSIRVNKSSSLDSALSCSFHPGGTNVAAHIQYSISF